MARLGHPVFEFIAERLLLPDTGTVVDLGCGEGPALHAVARRHPDATLIGLDNNEQSLAKAARVLSGSGCKLVVADLDVPLPLDDGAVDAVLCHNVLECVTDPVSVVNEAARALRPGGQALLSHVDWDAIVVSGADDDLNRRVVHAYADTAQKWMLRANGQMGRQLTGLVNHSTLRLRNAWAHVTLGSELTGDPLARIDEIAHVLRRGAGEVTADDVAKWRAQIADAATTGSFFFAETAFVVLAERH